MLTRIAKIDGRVLSRDDDWRTTDYYSVTAELIVH